MEVSRCPEYKLITRWDVLGRFQSPSFPRRRKRNHVRVLSPLKLLILAPVPGPAQRRDALGVQVPVEAVGVRAARVVAGRVAVARLGLRVVEVGEPDAAERLVDLDLGVGRRLALAQHVGNGGRLGGAGLLLLGGPDLVCRLSLAQAVVVVLVQLTVVLVLLAHGLAVLHTVRGQSENFPFKMYSMNLAQNLRAKYPLTLNLKYMVFSLTLTRFLICLRLRIDSFHILLI